MSDNRNRTRQLPGCAGYTEAAQTLMLRYESIGFAEKHAAILHLLPAEPGRVLDVGAGSGADAGWFAAQGHHVLAIEPTTALRTAAMIKHPSERIQWLDDSLPELAFAQCGSQLFDLIMLTAVWMHLDRAERERAMPKLVAVLKPGGRMMLSLRHGPLPAGRTMFAVSAEETVALASQHGLRSILLTHTESAQLINRQAGVSWSRLVFESPLNHPVCHPMALPTAG